MAYIPNLYNPYGQQTNAQSAAWMYPQMQSQPVNGLVGFDSIDDIRGYPLPPNSVSPPLFLSSENVFFVKRTDSIGTGSLKKYSFKEEPVQDDAASGEFVTKEYFDRQMSSILEAINGKHTVSEQQQQQQ